MPPANPSATEEQPKVRVISAAEVEKARTEAKKVIDKARAFIVLDHPFFASIMLKRPFVESLQTPTLGVTDGGTILYNPFFLKDLTVNQVVWAVCHEILHYASAHGIRRGTRDRKMWNVAGDMWINDTLNRSNIGEKIPGCLDVPGSADRTVEDIYASFPPDGGGGGKGQGKGQGQGDQDGDGEGSGDPLENDLQDDKDGQGNSKPKTESEMSEIDAQRKLEVAEAAQIAKMKGKLPGILQQFAADTIETKVPWYDILERFMTERVKNDLSWAKPNRRYAPDFYLPVVDGVGAMGEIAVQVDISGSVSPQEIKHYNGHLKRIVEQCRPNKVHVIYTDTQVQKHEVFDKPEDMEIRFYSGGGTDMRAGFKFLEDQGIEPECMVTLTDGYTPFPESTEVPSIWCISSDVESPCGENIHFELTED